MIQDHELKDLQSIAEKTPSIVFAVSAPLKIKILGQKVAEKNRISFSKLVQLAILRLANECEISRESDIKGPKIEEEKENVFII